MLQMFLLIVELVTVLLQVTVLGLVKIGNDDTGAIAVVVLVLLDMLILLLLLLKLAAPVLVLDTIDLVAGDDDDQAAVELEVLGKE